MWWVGLILDFGEATQFIDCPLGQLSVDWLPLISRRFEQEVGGASVYLRCPLIWTSYRSKQEKTAYTLPKFQVMRAVNVIFHMNVHTKSIRYCVCACVWQKKGKAWWKPFKGVNWSVEHCVRLHGGDRKKQLSARHSVVVIYCHKKWKHFKMLKVLKITSSRTTSVIHAVKSVSQHLDSVRSAVCQEPWQVWRFFFLLYPSDSRRERKWCLFHPVFDWRTPHLSPQQPWRQTESRTSRGPRPMEALRLGPAPAPLPWIPCLCMKGRRSR